MPPLKLCKISQQFRGESVQDIDRSLRGEPALRELTVKRGARLAVAVGSRGIASLARIVKSTVEILREKGAEPFIVPAMGSHGGATAEGQTALLASLGITEASVSGPIRSSMEVAPLGQGGCGIELCMDQHAFQSDGIVLINRIAHTDFHGQ
jgi:hypothetical protein